ncbi:protein O-mannosyl-transferase family [Kouleothrix sp.]|uniref:protein O-mannosyl-transferase family n=1 Tax=Kouleothrix sp. TaxID=2779161 RepID=UPI00391AEF8F
MHKSQGDQLSAGWRQGGERGHTAVSESKLSPGVAWRDILLACGVAAAALLLYAATLLPGLGSRDTAELQWVVPTLGLAHPTGYPLYTLLGWLWCQLPLGGTPAWRLNLFSAAAAAAALAVVYALARALGQRAPAAAIAALALGVSRAFWSQATVAEVYALAALLQALLLLALLRWRDGRWPLWLACLLLGLGLAHHRSIILMLPGALLFVLMSRRAGGARPAVASRDLVLGLGGLLAGGMLYLYVPLRAPAWMQSWRQVWDHISGASLTATWLDLARLRGEGLRRIFTLARAFVWPQFLPAGALLALLGGVRLLLRDRAAAALLLLGYALTLAFCVAYYVADVEVFFIPAHVLAAPLLGEGAMALGDAARRWLGGKQWRRALGAGLAALGAGYVALLLWQNLPAVRALNSTDDERIAREVLAQPLPPGALVLGDWYSTEGPRYLQTIEGLRPDVQFGSGIGRASVIEALDHGRAVYLSAPDVELGLAQWPEGRLWRVGRAPLEAAVAASAAWADGVGLSGYTLPPGPYHPGDGVPVMLQWQALGAPSASYSFFVHLVGPDGQIWGQHDQPAPTERWQPGKRYADLVSPTLKPGAPPGRYRVTLGWYAYPSMRRLALADASADYITLGQIDVAAR